MFFTPKKQSTAYIWGFMKQKQKCTHTHTPKVLNTKTCIKRSHAQIWIILLQERSQGHQNKDVSNFYWLRGQTKQKYWALIKGGERKIASPLRFTFSSVLSDNLQIKRSGEGVERMNISSLCESQTAGRAANQWPGQDISPLSRTTTPRSSHKIKKNPNTKKCKTKHGYTTESTSKT